MVSRVSDIKVTDKRMFTAEGELRDEYRDLADAAPAEAEPPAPVAAEPPPPPPPITEPVPSRVAPPPLELPDTGPSALGQPSFYDLAAILAEPVQVYLGDLPLPDGGSAENLEMARLHIDLLAILRQKTAGNLSAQESAFLEDLLYRLRLRYVQKRG
jgi:hypothetical protein